MNNLWDYKCINAPNKGKINKWAYFLSYNITAMQKQGAWQEVVLVLSICGFWGNLETGYTFDLDNKHDVNQ